MHSALDVLDRQRLDVLYPGDDVFPLAPRARAVGIAALREAVRSRAD